MSERLNLDNAKIRNFVDHVKTECKAMGIKVELRKSKTLNLGKGIRCAGYFDEEGMKLVVAVNHPLALGVLVHEYGHFTQWVENIPIWKKAGSSLNYVEAWLNGEEVKNIKKWIALSRDLELDNEKRTVKLIKEFGLPIDVDLYTKRANAYVLFYNWLLTSRRWSSPSNSPYRNSIILEACSTKFNMKYGELSARVRQAFVDAGI